MGMDEAPELSVEEQARVAAFEAAEEPIEVAFERCAAWLETLASPTLTNDPFIRAVDWAAKLVREYAAEAVR